MVKRTFLFAFLIIGHSVNAQRFIPQACCNLLDRDYTCIRNNPVSIKPLDFFYGSGHGIAVNHSIGQFWSFAAIGLAFNTTWSTVCTFFPAHFDKDDDIIEVE